MKKLFFSIILFFAFNLLIHLFMNRGLLPEKDDFTMRMIGHAALNLFLILGIVLVKYYPIKVRVK